MQRELSLKLPIKRAVCSRQYSVPIIYLLCEVQARGHIHRWSARAGKNVVNSLCYPGRCETPPGGRFCEQGEFWLR